MRRFSIVALIVLLGCGQHVQGEVPNSPDHEQPRPDKSKRISRQVELVVMFDWHEGQDQECRTVGWDEYAPLMVVETGGEIPGIYLGPEGPTGIQLQGKLATSDGSGGFTLTCKQKGGLTLDVSGELVRLSWENGRTVEYQGGGSGVYIAKGFKPDAYTISWSSTSLDGTTTSGTIEPAHRSGS